MPTVSSDGSQTTTIGVEHTLANPTGNKFYSAIVDLANMESGDTVEIRVSIIAKTAGSYRQYWIETYDGAQTDPMVYIPNIASDIGYKLTLKQTAGTGRVYDYKVFEV